MHDQRWDDIHEAVNQMTPAEKRDLIDQISRSLDPDHRLPPGDDMMTSEQKQAVMELLDEVERLPLVEEPADGLVASRDHDKILYGQSPEPARPERPGK